jgi:uncharacterized protein YecT (DUF1311 family)
MRIIFPFFILVLFCAAFPFAVQAQSHNVYCDKANSTAAFQSCVKRHYAAAQKDLNAAYDELSADMPAEEMDKLRELQNAWLAYRDNECAWEASRIEDGPLVKIYELSCQAQMTEARTALLLTTAGNSEAAGQVELSGFPRWMNALTSDYPDVFWRFGQRKRLDLNCDGAEEIVMVGAAVSRMKKLEAQAVSDDAGRTPQAMDVVIAVTGNPPTGRPQSQIFRLPITDTLEGPSLCDAKISLRQIEEEPAEESESCHQKIEISSKNCDPVFLSWTGKDYALTSSVAKTDETTGNH